MGKSSGEKTLHFLVSLEHEKLCKINFRRKYRTDFLEMIIGTNCFIDVPTLNGTVNG